MQGIRGNLSQDQEGSIGLTLQLQPWRSGPAGESTPLASWVLVSRSSFGQIEFVFSELDYFMVDE